MKQFVIYAMVGSVACMSSLSLANETSSQPIEAASYVKPVLGLGLNFGGDTIREYEVEYYDGDDGTESVKAGEGIHFFGGVELGYPANDLAFRLQLGYMFGGIFAENGDVSFDRIPFEALMFICADKLKFGAGVTHHTNVELKDDVAGDVSFDNATGAVIQAEYWFTQRLGLGLRYTNIEYQPEDFEDADLNGSGGGLYLTFAF